MCVCAPNSPAGLLYCQSTGPVVCLADPFISHLFRLAIVSQIFPTLSNLLSASLCLSPTGPSGYYSDVLDLAGLSSLYTDRHEEAVSWKNRLGGCPVHILVSAVLDLCST